MSTTALRQLQRLAGNAAVSDLVVQRNIQRGPLRISSRAVLPAADGRTPDSRHTVAVGEIVELTASHADVTWAVPEAAVPAGRARRTPVYWASPGVHTVKARRRSGEEAAFQMRVVLPSIRTGKLSALGFPQLPEQFAAAGARPTDAFAAMAVSHRLTPTNVSFEGYDFLEQDRPPTRLDGYFQENPGAAPRTHGPNPSPVRVSSDNRVSMPDSAAFALLSRHMTWPLSRGTFAWPIPHEYTIPNGVGKLIGHTSVEQRVEIAPTSPTGEFEGTITVTKGHAVDRRTYPPRGR
jgi:hypothetical protein